MVVRQSQEILSLGLIILHDEGKLSECSIQDSINCDLFQPCCREGALSSDPCEHWVLFLLFLSYGSFSHRSAGSLTLTF